jgi:hypothetical protein
MVLSRLGSIEKTLEHVHGEVIGLRIAVAKLQIKAGLMGAIAGSIPALIAALILLL